MKESFNSNQVKAFLKDYLERSSMEILEEGKEKDELFEIAKARGIDLKNNQDLAGFKCVYAFVDVPNDNGAVLPKKALLKALPTLVGKPVDLDHIREKVVGHLLDSRFIVKDNSVTAYGVFYKSNFADEWETAKDLFKAGKLGQSFEIWSDKSKRKYREDGSYELNDMTIAGSALLFKTKPAFKDAKVLELAKERTQPDLVFASKYTDEEILTASETVAVPPQTPVAPEVKVEAKPKVKCANCGKELDKPSMDEYKCPECFAIINTNGELLYPPQIIDFQIACLKCSSRNWKLIKQDEKQSEIKCLSCAKSYEVTFANDEQNEYIQKLNCLHIGSTSCKQCGSSIEYYGVSKMKEYNLTCHKCGLQFKHELVNSEKGRKIALIEEKKIQADLAQSATIQEGQGEIPMEVVEKKEEVVVEQATQRPTVEPTPQAEVVVAAVEAKPEPTVEKPVVASVEEPKVEAAPVVEVAKVEEAPKEEPVVASQPIEEPKAIETPKQEEVTIVKEEAKCKPQKEEIGKRAVKVAKKLAKKIKEMKRAKEEELKKMEECNKASVEFYKENALEIASRKKELGEFAKDLSDVDILNEEKFTAAKLVKANKEIEEAANVVGTKKREAEHIKSLAQEVDDRAFGRKVRTS